MPTMLVVEELCVWEDIADSVGGREGKSGRGVFGERYGGERAAASACGWECRCPELLRDADGCVLCGLSAAASARTRPLPPLIAASLHPPPPRRVSLSTRLASTKSFAVQSSLATQYHDLAMSRPAFDSRDAPLLAPARDLLLAMCPMYDLVSSGAYRRLP